jgi:DNA topoisomerase I
MGKSLVIVESPAKAKTINKYLGKEYVVKSCVGHIRDLPTSGSRKKIDPKERARIAAKTRKLPPAEKEAFRKKREKEQMVRRMGIDPENGWTAQYTILPGKEKVVDELKEIAAGSDLIYLATDLDREGEAIAWHLKQVLNGNGDRYQRVIFNEITKNAIQEAFKHPMSVDDNRVKAQQTRRFLDRVVGFMLSPLLWAKIARGLSAGRVQSVAVRLIVEREKEIRSFIPDEYWEVLVHLLAGDGASIPFKVMKHDGKAFRPCNKTETDFAVAYLKKAEYRIAKREDKPTRTRPKPAFITSTLQQAGSTRLGFSVKKVMVLAQRLYEAGYITYMRTDSTALSSEALDVCRGYITKHYGDRYLPDRARFYSNKEGAQEAHEAIRPTDVTVTPGSIKGLDRDAEKLYDLIWRQFVACQMPDAEYLSTTITVESGGYELRARGRVVTFDGFMKILPPVSKGDEDMTLPDIKVDTHLDLDRIEPSQHFTKPAPRYTEASLVKELEKRGIGRPSTYASIISTIQSRGYVRLEGRRFHAEKMGDIVTERLVENFDELMDYNFTADMEKTLDEIANGATEWKSVLDEFYAEFTRKLDTAYDTKRGMRPNDPTETDISCPSCGRHMQVRTAGTGVFLGCSGYVLPPKERCKTTINLIPGEEAIRTDTDEEDDESESRSLMTKHRCKLCGTAMENYLIDEKRKLHVCGNNPDCPGFEVENGEFKIRGYDGPVIECDKCGTEMQLKTGRFGKYFDCTNDECKNTRKLMRNGEPAPPKMDPVPMPELKCLKVDDYYLLRDGAAGLFLAASRFPQNRETRSPLVEEIIPHKDEIDPKYAYMFDAPTVDPEGNKTIIRYSRKTKEQYLMSEKEGKATGWRAYYRDGRWVPEQAKKKSSGGKSTAKKSTGKKAKT